MKFNLYVRSSILAALALGVFIMTIKGSETSLQEERRSWGEAQEGFRLGIHSGDEQTFSAKQAIVPIVTLKNVSNAELQVLVTSQRHEYELFVRDEKDRNVPLTQFGDRLYNYPKSITGRSLRTMKAGETQEDNFHLNRIFDMSLTGKYYFHISRSVPKRVGDGFVKIESKRIAINVTD